MLLLLDQPAPSEITNFAPSSGAVGSEIRIYGSGFSGLSGATVSGTALSGFVVISDSQVRGTIAAGTTTGRIVAGAATSTTDFIVTVGGAYADEQAQDAAGAALVAGQHSGVAFSYGATQDGANRIDARLQLPSPGLFYWDGAALQSLGIGAGLAVVGGELVATGGYTPQAQAYFARLTGTYSNTWQDAVNTLISTLISAGVWAKRDAIWLGTTVNFADSLINLKSTAYPLVLSGTITNSLTGGWQGGGGSFDSGYSIGASGILYSQNDCGFDLWAADAPETSSEANWHIQIGCGFFVLGQAGFGASRIVPRAPTTFYGLPAAGRSLGAIQSSGADISDFTYTDYAPGFIQFNRINSSGFHSAYGAVELSATTPSVSTVTGNFRIANYGWLGRWLCCSVGAGLTVAEQTAYRGALANFFTAIGAS